MGDMILKKNGQKQRYLTNGIVFGVKITLGEYIARASRFGEQLNNLSIDGMRHTPGPAESIKDFKLLNEVEKNAGSS